MTELDPILADFAYAPIRARIQASLAPEEAEDAVTVTNLCLIVAAIAHGQQSTWLRIITEDLPEQEALELLADVQKAWPDEIAAVKTVSDNIAAFCRAHGLAHREEAIVNGILRRDFFQMREDTTDGQC